MNQFIHYSLGIALILSVSACSNKDQGDSEHLMSTQQRALEKAQNVDAELQAAQDKKRKMIEQSFSAKEPQE